MARRAALTESIPIEEETSESPPCATPPTPSSPTELPTSPSSTCDSLASLKRTHLSNSTSSLYCKTVLTAPDLEQLLLCTAMELLSLLRRNTPDKRVLPIFSEQLHPLTITISVDLSREPTQDEIHKFYQTVFHAMRLDPEVAIMSLSYVESLFDAGCSLCAETWRRLTLSCIMVASKVWEDQAIWNADFLPSFDQLSVEDLNLLEMEFLNLMHFSVGVSRSRYVDLYTRIRKYSLEYFPLQPLSPYGADKLDQTFNRASVLAAHATAATSTTSTKNKNLVRCNSSEAIVKQRGRMVLS
ncbi:cyclin domain protein [Pelomyxa schiedti]|nr:cyclin domain protein [Pelomyxa schiedti]